MFVFLYVSLFSISAETDYYSSGDYSESWTTDEYADSGYDSTYQQYQYDQEVYDNQLDTSAASTYEHYEESGLYNETGNLLKRYTVKTCLR